MHKRRRARDDPDLGRAGGRRRSRGRGDRLLARRRRAPGARGREEALPPREDVRRRPHAAGRPPARRHGPRPTSWRAPALRRPALDRPRRDPRAAVARAPRLPRLRLRRAPPRPRPDGRRRGRRRGRRGLDRAPRPSPRWSRTAWSWARSIEARRRRASRCGPATWWSPTAPTPASGGRSAPRATAPTRSAWRCGATSPARSTTSRGSRATSTCATATATTCPGYGWIFPVGDGTVNVGVGLLSTFTGWKDDQHQHADGRVRRDRAGALGHLARDVVRRAHRREAADRRVGRRPTSGPRGWWSATPPAR